MTAVFGWINRQARIWWPIVATTTAFAVIGTMIFVVAVVVEQRDDLRQEAEADEVSRALLADVVERQRREEVGRQERLAGAVTQVEARVADLFALHDENVARKLNDTLHRIEVLLGRPVSAPAPATPRHPMVPSTTPPPTAAPKPAPRPAAPSPAPPPATTTPDQKSCDKHPDGPRC